MSARRFSFLAAFCLCHVALATVVNAQSPQPAQKPAASAPSKAPADWRKEAEEILPEPNSGKGELLVAKTRLDGSSRNIAGYLGAATIDYADKEIVTVAFMDKLKKYPEDLAPFVADVISLIRAPTDKAKHNFTLSRGWMDKTPFTCLREQIARDKVAATCAIADPSFPILLSIKGEYAGSAEQMDQPTKERLLRRLMAADATIIDKVLE